MGGRDELTLMLTALSVPGHSKRPGLPQPRQDTVQTASSDKNAKSKVVEHE